ncbi:spore coat protein YsxE [Salipaludibacillus sp. CF4.18]|uniref:spore coat protein YsxE n=1 Tax=Salipaludibacillus sp. CF4.18 TaxID=3373081 RepID=UPI003EE4BC8C
MMKETLSTPSIRAILFHYDLFPQKLEAIGKIVKVETRYGTFALKQTKMTREEGEWFIHVIRRLDRMNYPFVVPIIPTKYGDYLAMDDHSTYYLMPWYEDHHEFRHPVQPEETLIEEIAKLHGLTERVQDYSEESILESYNHLKKRWDLRKLEVEKFVDRIEAHTFYSPFEMAFLTHFERVSQMAKEAERNLDLWLEKAKELKSYRSVLCHGRVKRNHALFDPYGAAHFINFEKAVLDSPARDLATLFRHFFHEEPWNDIDGLHWLAIYEKQFALFDDERHLFISYLAFPESIYQMMDHYVKPDRTISELACVKQLERRLLTMGRIHRLMNEMYKKE